MIEILPESSGNLVAARATGTLTGDDYAAVWEPRLRQAIEEHGKVRVLLYLDEAFDGWDAGAMWEDAKFGLAHFNDFEKIAVVGGEEWVGKVVDLFGKLMPAAVKSFPTGSLEQAPQGAARAAHQHFGLVTRHFEQPVGRVEIAKRLKVCGRERHVFHIPQREPYRRRRRNVAAFGP